MKKLAFAIMCVLVTSPVFAGMKDKKIIVYGDVPDTQFVREHIQDMEKGPFDGVVIHVGRRDAGDSISSSPWGKKKFEPKDYEFAIEDLKANKFQRLTENFIQTVTVPGDVDWFDPEWSTIAHNFACLAQIAKQGGCKGIILDPEVYVSYPVWSYADLPRELKSAHTYKEYQAKARERGREWIRAVNKEFPDITILSLWGYSLPYIETHIWARRPLEDIPSTLLTAFFDGIVDAATPQTVLVDGYESSYTYRDRWEFLKGRKWSVTDSLVVSRSRKEFKKHVRSGFGIWMDTDNFRPDDPSHNYFTPAGFRAAVNYALDTCDKYVWIYSEKTPWWTGSPPKPYVEALELARTGPGAGEPHPKVSITKAADLTRHTDELHFAKLPKTLTAIFDVPKDGWKFKFDKSGKGFRNRWYAESLDDSNWLNVSIGRFWEEDFGHYDGLGWYRAHFTAPAGQPGKSVWLAFGGVDDGARVWLNGKFVGAYDTSWAIPFAFEVTKQLRPGKDNLLAVEVTDYDGPGGLYKAVKLMVK